MTLRSEPLQNSSVPGDHIPLQLVATAPRQMGITLSALLGVRWRVSCVAVQRLGESWANLRMRERSLRLPGLAAANHTATTRGSGTHVGTCMMWYRSGRRAFSGRRDPTTRGPGACPPHRRIFLPILRADRPGAEFLEERSPPGGPQSAPGRNAIDPAS